MFYHFYDFIKNKYFDELKVLPPATREALIFKKTCEEIPLTIKEGDVIAGWYGCESDADIKIENNRDFAFVDAYTKKERSIKQKLLSDFCIDSGRARAHTCIDYGHIITFGLKDYEKKVMRFVFTNRLKTDMLFYGIEMI